jgi:hypothetical protein
LLVLGIYREEIFSPGRVEDDKQIMDAALTEMRALGYAIRAVSADALDAPLPGVGCVLTMAQSRRALSVLEAWGEEGVLVINAPSAIYTCRRTSLIRVLDIAGLPLPPGEIVSLEDGNAVGRPTSHSFSHCWLKRGDVHRIRPGDVVKATSEPEFAAALDHFRTHRIPKVVIQGHLEGEVVKFYGIRNGYFAGFGASGNGDGAGRLADLRSIAKLAADSVGLEIYGGDAVITPDGRTVLIDLNAWPSFSRCRQDASRSIASYAAEVIAGAIPALNNGNASNKRLFSVNRS